VRVEFAGQVVAESDRALRVLETSGPPVIYIPAEDVRTELLRGPAGATTICEWKGVAEYRHLAVGDRVARRAAWTYPEPMPGYEAITDHYAFYAGRVDAAYLDDELVRPQPGRFYGGWITDDIVGPLKGEPGTEGW
jgi:uncharacterized protein (DUF427 family)